jgi:hypothetical protein
MDVRVLSIERNEAKAHGRHEVVYDVTTEIDAIPHAFEVLVGSRKIGADPVPYATFRDPDELRIFARDHRPITEILRRVTAAHNHEQVALPTSTLARH